MKWRDDNFRGMGDKLEVSVTKKEGLEGNSMSLYPDMLLRWSGNSIGSTASISMSTNQESNFRALADLIPRYITKEFEETSLNRFLIRQQPTRSSVTTAKFQV